MAGPRFGGVFPRELLGIDWRKHWVGRLYMQANSVLLNCRGWRLKGCYVPPFAVRSGELVRIQFPNLASVPRYDFRNALCAADGHDIVQSVGAVIAARFSTTRTWWQELFHRQRAGEWFRQRTGCSATESQSYLERVGLRYNAPLCELAGTPCKLLAIQAAFALRCDVLIFDTDGLDPLGMRDVLNAVVGQLGDSAAIYLASSHDRHEPEIEYSAVIQVEFDATMAARPHSGQWNQASPLS
jgi:hypothetical protein